MSAITIIEGESYAALRELPEGMFDAVVTDPPYSSGGLSRADRSRSPEVKHRHSGSLTVDPSFSGDNRDQRSYVVWGAKGLSSCGPKQKLHLAGKPIELMHALLAPLAPGSRVLDPFAGSGSTGVAAQELGIEATLIEVEPAYTEIIRERLASGNVLFRHERNQGTFAFEELS
ncbi:MAG: DNA methyltransferase [Deltaproteobacteria bacterium]|nr:DNA methyltransferase [Deltaproteobacteria bacterium]